MRRPEFPQRSCREHVEGDLHQVGLCDVVELHPGPHASLAIPSSVTRREAWEAANPDWETWERSDPTV